tara:strand:+ start:14 stop:1516 length:1503 start_codon:yes stop_codon:yes gene_type:complete
MAFGLLNSIIPQTGTVTTLHTGDTDKLTVGKITVGSKNYNPSRIQIGYKDGTGDVKYFEYNRYIKYGEVIETENLYLGAGQDLVIRSTEPDVNFLFYGETTNDVINPVRSGVLSHTLSTGATKQALFTAPVGSESKVTVSICNLGPDVATVKLGLSNGNLALFDSTEYLDFGFKIGPGQTYTRPDIKLGEGQSLIGFSNPKSQVTFLCHGKLFYEVSGLPTSDDFVVLGNSRFDGNVGVGRSATVKLDVVGDTIITGNTKIKSVNYNEDIDNVRNLRTIGISTFTGDVIIKGDTTDIQSQILKTKSNNIILGFHTGGSFIGSITAGSPVITNVSPTDNIIVGIGVSFVSATGNLNFGSGVTVVSIAASTVTLSANANGNGSDPNATFSIESASNNNIADNGGIIIRGQTDKTILWQQNTGRFNFSHGITLNSGILQIMDGTSKVSIGLTDVLTSDKVLGYGITSNIYSATDNDDYLVTAKATTTRARQVSAEGYFASNSI